MNTKVLRSSNPNAILKTSIKKSSKSKLRLDHIKTNFKEEIQKVEVIKDKKKESKNKVNDKIRKINYEDILNIYQNGLANQLEHILESNKSIENEYLVDQEESVFFCSVIPMISIKDYIIRLTSNSGINPSTIILMGLYIDRFCSNIEFHMTYKTVFRIILASFYAAVKYNEDSIFSIENYCKLGGVSADELRFYEFAFLNGIDYSLYVKKIFILSAKNTSYLRVIQSNSNNIVMY